jgi:hypothetical protein
MSNIKAKRSKSNVVYQQRPYNVVIPDLIRNPVFSIWIPAQASLGFADSPRGQATGRRAPRRAFAGMTKIWDQGLFQETISH